MKSFRATKNTGKNFWKHILICLFCLTLLSIKSYADLGMTKEEAVERFGKPIYLAEPNDPMGDWEVYSKGKWLILLSFDKNGVSDFCSYKLRDMREFDDQTISSILKRNEPITGVLSEISFSPDLIEASLESSGLPEQTKKQLRELPTRSRGWLNIANSYHACFDIKKKTLVLYRHKAPNNKKQGQDEDQTPSKTKTNQKDNTGTPNISSPANQPTPTIE